MYYAHTMLYSMDNCCQYCGHDFASASIVLMKEINLTFRIDLLSRVERTIKCTYNIILNTLIVITLVPQFLTTKALRLMLSGLAYMIDFMKHQQCCVIRLVEYVVGLNFTIIALLQ